VPTPPTITLVGRIQALCVQLLHEITIAHIDKLLIPDSPRIDAAADLPEAGIPTKAKIFFIRNLLLFIDLYEM
jgi:hypothetical protein